MHPKNIHFIGIGGSVMSSLAIALKNMGQNVTGSDDHFYDPSRSRLAQHGLLPSQEGWYAENISPTLDEVIVAMHAKKDNPELVRAQELQIPIHSFSDYIFNTAVDKHRIVVGGSHGKTTITSLIIHTLLHHKQPFDYVVGAKIKGIDNPVRISQDAPLIVIEGDEYLTSPLDPSPKLMKYHHHIGVISGVAWDHANVFPSQEEYNRIFMRFADATPRAGVLIYNAQDSKAKAIGSVSRPDVLSIPYEPVPYIIKKNQLILQPGHGQEVPIKLIGQHNVQNIAAACKVVEQLGISPDQFYNTLPLFEGADGRLNRLFQNEWTAVYRDFAHAPSKVKASTRAVKDFHPEQSLIGCMELHTLGSLNEDFLQEYTNTMEACSVAVVYYNQSKMSKLSHKDIQRALRHNNLEIFTEKSALATYIKSVNWKNKVLLMMSSGTFDGLDLQGLIHEIGQTPN